MNNPTIVVVTDRNDLDGQLFNTFGMAHETLKQVPSQAVRIPAKLNSDSGPT